MLNFKRAFCEAWTLRQLGFLFIADKLVVHLLGMARVAKMSIAPAEPLGNGTAELTLELYVVDAMLRTVFNPCAGTFGGTLTAYEILLLVLLSLILLLYVPSAIF